MEIKNSPRSNRWQAILMGGLAVALAENLPGLSLLDWLCCGTIWSGALLAVYWRRRREPQHGVPFSEAVALGVFAALFGAILNLGIDYAFKKPLTDVLRFFGENPAALAEKWREFFSGNIFQRLPMQLHVVFIVMSLVVHAIVGAIGGMLGATLFPPLGNAPQEE